MKVIIAGSRDIVESAIIFNAIRQSGFKIIEVISGNARGVDRVGETWAKIHNIPIKLFPVTSKEWSEIGPSAGHIRNRKMGDYADALIAVWDGKSPGTKSMITYMKKLNKKVFVLNLLEEENDPSKHFF